MAKTMVGTVAITTTALGHARLRVGVFLRTEAAVIIRIGTPEHPVKHPLTTALHAPKVRFRRLKHTVFVVVEPCHHPRNAVGHPFRTLVLCRSDDFINRQGTIAVRIGICETRGLYGVTRLLHFFGCHRAITVKVDFLERGRVHAYWLGITRKGRTR